MGREGLKDVRKDFSDRTRRKKVLFSHSIVFVWKGPVFEFFKYQETCARVFQRGMTHRVGLSSGICM